MITQGWPLWAVSEATGQVWAVVGWEDLRLTKPMGLEIGVELDEPEAVVLGGPVRFVTGIVTAQGLTR